MNNYSIVFIIIAYMLILFGVAFLADRNARSKWVNNGVIYSLSLAVYCTAWTYYGSIGIAANSGINFLPIYLGPIIASPLFIVVLRKIIRISRQQKISSIADFISLRYGNNRFLGAVVAILCLIGILPYISLQLKAVSDTFTILADETSYISKSIWDDSTFYIAVIIALFATFFGTQRSDASERRSGLIVSVAFESILKLVFFLIVGFYITFILFDGTIDIVEKASKLPNFKNLVTLNSYEQGFTWFYTTALSFIAIFLLPRQFHTAVVENVRERHIKTAVWMFPLYLLLFNVFVIFIAWAGNIQINDPNIAEYYALILPLENGNILLAILVFLGGLSAVISMIVVASLSLATMLSNNLIIPYGFLNRFLKSNPEKNTQYIKMIRRTAIFSIIIAAYFFYINYSIELSLYSIGLMAFVIIAQLAPSFFLGLIWKRGLSQAAILGIVIGFIVVCYTLIIPFIMQSYNPNASFINEGLFSISILKPHALFGLDFLSAPAHAFFWSLLANTLTYCLISLTRKGNYRERNYAELFIDSKNLSELQDQALVWKGEAYVSDIKNVLVKFLGEIRTKKSLDTFFSKYNIPKDTQMADSRLINFSEKLLTGSIGSASAKILIDSVVKEEEVSLPEVLKILEESKETIVRNKLLKEKSKELSKLTKQLTKVNNQLIEKDRQKDEFLDTLAHELKTPITGIRAATELLLDDIDEMPTDIKEKFLKNMLNDSDRLTRLIQNILDFEKLATGRILLQPKKHSLNKTVIDTLTSLKNIAHKKGVQLECTNASDHRFLFDEDRIKQVLTNLISNAIKFCEENKGKVVVDYKYNNGNIEVYVIDNGKGIEEEDLPYIFDRFYQSKDQNTRKPEGSGLGLAISKKIIDIHNGKIWALNNEKSGATFGFMLPFD